MAEARVQEGVRDVDDDASLLVCPRLEHPSGGYNALHANEELPVV